MIPGSRVTPPTPHLPPKGGGRTSPGPSGIARRAAAVAALLAAAPAAAADRSADDFFEAKVRPVLADHCWHCHGPNKQMAGLRVDTADGLRKGADDGPVVDPADPAGGRLLAAVRRSGDFPMPPTKPLPAAAVAALAEWVALGAPFPAAPAARSPAPAAAAKDHWAFRPVADPPVPATRTAPGSDSPIDRFVLARLEADGLALSPPADPRALVRRLSFDLTGLPPTAAEADRFAADPSPAAYAGLVDRLLASPHFGERWGRHWLDVARYADSKGYVFTEDRGLPFAYTYRDYVIRAFNQDLPYDRFVVEQLAADRLPPRADNAHLAALGFLTVGRRFLNPHDTVDDRIDAVTRGLMGLTVSCARCHDHKYDPVPTADYYSLYGVFAAAVEPDDPPCLDRDDTPDRRRFEAELAAKRQAARDFERAMYARFYARFRTPEAVAAYLLAARRAAADRLTADQLDAFATAGKLEVRILARWREYLSAPGRAADPVFGPWLAAAAVPDAGFAAQAPAVLADALSKSTHPAVAAALTGATFRSADELAAVYGRLLADAAGHAGPPAPATAALADALIGPGGATVIADVRVADKLIPIAVKKEFRQLRNAAQRFRRESPDAPPYAMSVVDAGEFADPVVFVRGNPANRGPAVPRRFLAALDGPDRKPFADGAGRLDLADKIASEDNPLTARVWVNRVWGHLFGKGLVRTPSDFGTRADPPTHPDLLDWLATRFTADDGWSTKALVRRIVLSATYCQSSAAAGPLAAADPDNRRLGRQNRKRLEFEPLWDSLLAAAGRLDRTVYGKSVNLFGSPAPARRAVYGFADRQNPAGVPRAFDVPSPDQHAPARFVTTVPQQALFLLNSPFAADQARAAAARPEVAAAPDLASKARALYRAVLSRDPDADEVRLAAEFVASAPPPEDGQLGPWEQVAQVLLMSNEFAFVD